MASLDETLKAGIPIPWVAFILLQTIGGTFWAANLQSSINTFNATGGPVAVMAEQDIRALEVRVLQIEAQGTQIPVNSNRLSRLETQVARMQQELDRMIDGRGGDAPEPPY